MELLQVIPVLLFAVIVHEVAHAWVARREGDDTADRLGRITLNPLPHLDLLGSFVVPALLVYSGAGFIFGWAKPVPVNPANYRDPVWSDVKVSLAGIAANLILAVISIVLAVVFFKAEAALGLGWLGTLGQTAQWSMMINVVLALFNLLPIPPLDGSHVLAHMLPKRLAAGYRALGRFGMLILIALIYFGGDLLFNPVFQLLTWLNRLVMGWV